MEKIGGLATALAVVIAIIAGIIDIPAFNAGLVIVLLGIVGGIGADQDGAVRMYVAVLALPAIGMALGGIPVVGGYLDAIFGNLALAAAGVSATLVVRRLYDMVMDGVKGLSSGS